MFLIIVTHRIGLWLTQNPNHFPKFDHNNIIVEIDTSTHHNPSHFHFCFTWLIGLVLVLETLCLGFLSLKSDTTLITTIHVAHTSLHIHLIHFHSHHISASSPLIPLGFGPSNSCGTTTPVTTYTYTTL